MRTARDGTVNQMTKPAISRRDQKRLDKMNEILYPAKLRVLPSGNFLFDYRKGKIDERFVIGSDMDSSYEKAILIRKQLDSTPVITNRKLTLETWHGEWSASHYKKLRITTVEGYIHSWKSIPSILKSTSLKNLTRDQIDRALDDITKPSMRDHAAAYMSTVLNAAVKRGHLQQSPWSYTSIRKKKNVPVLSADELVKVFALASPTSRIGLALAGFMGLRRSEIMGLKYGDFDINKNMLYITKARTKVWGKRAGEEFKGTKTGESRVLQIPDILHEIVSSFVTGQDKDELIYPVFRSDFPKRLRVACRKAGVPELDLHSLRHVCGSNLMMTGGIALAQAVLGHKDITTTVDTYGHLNSVYLSNQMNLANFSKEKLHKFSDKASKLITHNDPEVSEFAEKVLQICHYLSPDIKKGLTKTP